MPEAGGAIALIAIIGSDRIHALGFLYVLIPAGLGALIMLLVAPPRQQHPRLPALSRILALKACRSGCSVLVACMTAMAVATATAAANQGQAPSSSKPTTPRGF